MTDMREHWIALAKRWAQGRMSKDGIYKGDGHRGLCLLALEMYGESDIGLGICRAIDNKVRDQIWMAPLNEEGALVRIKFCIRQARIPKNPSARLLLKAKTLKAARYHVGRITL